MNKNKFAGGWLGKLISWLCFRKMTRLAVEFKRNRCCAGDPGTCTLINALSFMEGSTPFLWD